MAGTPILFIDGIVHRGGYDPPTLLAALATTTSHSTRLAELTPASSSGIDLVVDGGMNVW